MPTPTPWLAALATGLLWGLTTPDLVGCALVLLGSRAAVETLEGSKADLIRGALVGTLFGALFLRWLPGVWTMAGGHDASIAINLFVASLALGHAAVWALASLLRRQGLSAPVALTLAFTTLAEPLAALWPLPALPPALSCAHPLLLGPAHWGGLTALVAVTTATGAFLGTRRGALLMLWWLGSGLPLSTPVPNVRVGVLLPDTDAFDGSRASATDARMQRLEALMDMGPVDWMVTPETAWPTGQPLPVPAQPMLLGVGGAHNSLVTLGQPESRFAKRVLVPDLEDQFQPGHQPRHLTIAGTRVAPLICYEDFFPGVLREGLTHDPDILVAATNDAWVTDTPGEGWHLAAARLAAASSGRWMVRPANGGVSTVLDAGGRTRWEAGPSGNGRRASVDVASLHPWWSGAQLSWWAAVLAALLSAMLGTNICRFCTSMVKIDPR